MHQTSHDVGFSSSQTAWLLLADLALIGELQEEAVGLRNRWGK